MKIKGIHAAPALVTIVGALMLATSYIDISKISKNTNPYLTVMILQLICIGLPAVFFCLLRPQEYRHTLGLRIPKVRHITISVYALIMLVSGGIALSILMYMLFPEAFSASGMDMKNLNIAEYTDKDSIYAALTFAILPAILEEFLFRGVVRSEYSKYGALSSVLLSSLLFGMLHFTPVRLPIYVFSGIVLALLAGACNSIIPSVLVHIANNLFVLYFEKYIYKIAGKHSGGLTLLAFIVVSVLLLAAILFFGRAQSLHREFAMENRPSPLIKKVKISDSPLIVQSILSPTLLIFVVLYVAAAFLL